MKHFRWITVVLILALSVLIVPGSALAQGSAAGDQYTEQIPGADGNGSDDPANTSSNTGNNTGNDSGGSTDSPVISDGGSSAPVTDPSAQSGGNKNEESAKDLANRTAPSSDALRAAAIAAQAGDADTTGGIFSSVDNTSDDNGMGILLPIILVVALATAVSYAVWRRRRGSSPKGGDEAAPSHA